MERAVQRLRAPARRPDACSPALLLLAMTLLIGADVVLRNVGLGGIAWSNEVSEDILYLVDAAVGALAAAPGPAHPRRHSAARAAAAHRLAARMDRRHHRARLLRSISSGTAQGAGRELPGRRDLDQDAGDAGMVAAGADAVGVPAAGRSSSCSACTGWPRPSGRRARTRCRRHDARGCSTRREGSDPCPGRWPRCCCSAARRCCCSSACRWRSRSSPSTSSAPWLFLGGEAGLAQVVRNSVAVGDELLAHARSRCSS